MRKNQKHRSSFMPYETPIRVIRRNHGVVSVVVLDNRNGKRRKKALLFESGV